MSFQRFLKGVFYSLSHSLVPEHSVEEKEREKEKKTDISIHFHLEISTNISKEKTGNSAGEEGKTCWRRRKEEDEALEDLDVEKHLEA